METPLTDTKRSPCSTSPLAAAGPLDMMELTCAGGGTGAVTRAAQASERVQARKQARTDLEPAVVRALEDDAHSAQLRLVAPPARAVAGALREAIGVLAAGLDVGLAAAGAARGEAAEVE